ncbi:hypothetical protein E1B28_011848 [Marasmius oreades]|uniref:Uncharacterized protein n=1 Tax=Marasmius oreades TaxID=181124 RepID=A0A9P7RVN8_9AGAR|nr:uncharacterized protein E1B28_011848 [Marasmius oreades]KAG7090250.1 hypothetical protein E1B28_011848 [Marasmius oreades]
MVQAAGVEWHEFCVCNFKNQDNCCGRIHLHSSNREKLELTRLLYERGWIDAETFGTELVERGQVTAITWNEAPFSFHLRLPLHALPFQREPRCARPRRFDGLLLSCLSINDSLSVLRSTVVGGVDRFLGFHSQSDNQGLDGLG